MPSGINSFTFCADYSAISNCLSAIEAMADNGDFSNNTIILNLLNGFENDVLRKLYNTTIRVLGDLEGVSITPEYLLGDFEYIDFSNMDFNVGFAGDGNTGYSSRFQMILNIFAIFCSRSAELSNADVKSVNAAVIPVLDAFKTIQGYLIQNGLNPCVNFPQHFKNASTLYLQAAGADGSNGIAEGIHLRWSFMGDLGRQHLPQGDYYTSSSNPTGYNKSEDYVVVSRTAYLNQVRFPIDFETVPPASIDYLLYRWTYLLNLVSEGSKITNLFRLTFKNTTLYNQAAVIINPLADPFGFLKLYNGLIEIEVDDKTIFAVAYDFRLASGISNGTLKMQMVSVSDVDGVATETVNIRKTIQAATLNPVTGTIMGDNILKIHITKSAGSFLQSLVFEAYADFNSTRTTGDWSVVGSQFALSLTDQIVFDRLETTDYPIDDLWPQYGNGTLVKTSNYRDKWLTTHTNDSSIKNAVQLYLSLSETDPRAITVLKDDDAPVDEAGMPVSMLDILNLMALDYHWARMLGLGHIDTGINNLGTDQFIYKISYANRPNPNASLMVTYEYLSIPTGKSDKRLPEKPVLLPLTYQPPVQNGANAGVFTDDGYGNYANVRLVNISRQAYPYEILADSFFTDASFLEDFDTFGHSIPVFYGIEYRPETQASYVKPAITDDKSLGFVYYAYDIDFPLNGIPEVTPVPDNQTSLYMHLEKQAGVHVYAIYGINWFARASELSSEAQTDETFFPTKNNLLPPTSLTVQYIQTEDPLIFTTGTEQSWLYGRQTAFPGQDTDFTRLTFNWLDINDISDIQDMTTFDYSSVIKPDRVKAWFKPGQPLQVTGVVTQILPVSGQENLSLLFAGNYSLLDGSIDSPVVPAADFARFGGSLLTTPEGQFRVDSVYNGVAGPVFVIEKMLEVATVEDPDEPGFYGSLDVYTQPAAGSRFTVTENLSQTLNWLPLAEEIQLIDYGNAGAPITEISADSEGNITRLLIGGITGSAVVLQLTDINDQSVLPGYYSVTFDPAVTLAAHPQASLPYNPAFPGANSPGTVQTPFVDWYNGQVRMPIQGSRDKKLLSVIRIVQSSPLMIYVFDADYQTNGIQISASPVDKVDLVNFHPGYKAYLYAEPAPYHSFNRENILPGIGETNRKTLIGLQAADTRAGGSGFVSIVSTPAILLAVKIMVPIQLPAPITYGLKVRPDATSKAAFTFDMMIAPDSSGMARSPFGFIFYRTTNEDILEALYAPETIASILGSLVALTIDNHFNQRYLELANLVFDPSNPGNFNMFDASPNPYGFPMPDRTGLTNAGDSLAVKTSKYQNAIIATLLPLTNQTPVFSLIKTGYQTENKLPTIRTIDGNLIDSSDPNFDPFPMIRKYTSTEEPNTTYVRYADYTLNGSARFLYFFGAAEVTNKLVIGPLSTFAGPVSILHTVPADAPILRYFALGSSTGGNLSPLAVTFFITPFSPEDTITKVRIFRTTDQTKALSLYAMDSYIDMDIATDLQEGIVINDRFSDLTSIPLGEVIYYRLAFIRTIINEFELPEDVVGLGSAIIPVRLIDTVNPQAPDLNYDQLNNRLFWTGTANKATYYVFQQNAKGNWGQLAKIEPGAPLQYNIGNLAAADADGNTLYYRFKVKAENGSGLFNLTDNEFTIAGTSL